ncbi:MAG: hypothetical protein AB1631_19160 [Acidobacteriota bacterium]
MQKLATTMIAFLAFAVCAAPSCANISVAQELSQNSAAPKIGVIKKPALEGCGCSLQFPSDYRKHNDRYVFLSDLDDVAQMNIDGEDVLLKLVSKTESKGRIGSRHSETYAAEGTKVRVNFVVTKLCDPKDEGCEVTWYSAIIAVNINGKTQKMKVTGVCGC